MKPLRSYALLVLQAVRIWRAIRQARWQARLEAPKPEPEPYETPAFGSWWQNNLHRSDREQEIADWCFNDDECDLHQPLDPFDDRDTMECGCLVGSHSELFQNEKGEFFYLA